MKTQLRDVMNGSLRIEDVGKKVSLCGWCAKKRNLGGLIFVDLRDRSGIVQIVARPENKNYSLMEEVGNEYVLQVKGTVVERESKNSNLPTGDIEIDVDELRILSKAKQPPMIIADKTDALEDLRMKYRYLDLRRPVMQENMFLRSKVVNAIRSFYNSEGFIEVETPTFGKSTPEGARDYLVPSRVNPGKFYALPQSPQT
ncbi:MAG TPA: OB-fold nucleic acid binding domain-containing protein, partial [Bacilli bacterium]|nr:OB-fold nucleic acid binding domain-containing protein [Bacilli bacterium]